MIELFNVFLESQVFSIVIYYEFCLGFGILLYLFIWFYFSYEEILALLVNKDQ